MSAIIPLLFLAVFAYLAWEIRSYIHSLIEYRDARKAEIKKRLQNEAKADALWKAKIANAKDDRERLLFELQANRERHERSMKYVLQDLFERYN